MKRPRLISCPAALRTVRRSTRRRARRSAGRPRRAAALVLPLGAVLAAALAGCAGSQASAGPAATTHAKGTQRHQAQASPGRAGTGQAGTGQAPSQAGSGMGRAAAGQGAAGTDAPAVGQPARFWSGTDSWPVAINSKPPYREPVLSGSQAYGGYLGMAGNWARWSGCGGNIAWSSADSAAANTNYHKYGQGIGTGVYWFMAGPGVDPHYNGTTREASAWGAAQAAQTLHAMASLNVTYKVVWLDIELPEIAPAPDNGWNSVYTSPCSGKVRTGHIAPAMDRADVNGYEAYLTAHSSYVPGVYSSPLIWNQIFGTGKDASIRDTYEWTYTDGTSKLSRSPAGWCIPGTTTCARFFGGVTRSSPRALIWQWSGGGGITNGVGDFDQINVAGR
jgi:hypothetical protein